MTISHKKMNEIKDKLDNIFDTKEVDKEKDIFFTFLKDILNYDETKIYKYDSEIYQKYKKKYNENNREKINIQKAESANKRYYEKKLEKEKLKFDNIL